MKGNLLRPILAVLFAGALVQFAQVSREGTLTVRITDAGKPTPVRVRLRDSKGERPRVRGALAVSESAIPIPRQAIGVMFGQNDQAQGYAIQPDGSFYVDGSFDVRLPPGTYTLAITKGFEYTPYTQNIEIKPGAAMTHEVHLRRWMDMPSRGWYSADDHIHLRRSTADNPAIARWIAAEDIHIGNLLRMGDFWTSVYPQYAFGEAGRYTEAGRLLSPGQEEPRTPEIGHTISLGASEFVRMQPDYYSFDKLFDRVHQLGGVTGFAHQAMSFHGYRGMALNTLRGKTDFLELAQFCEPEGPLATQHYYEFLDMGFKLTALAGSDFPWCGVGPEYGFSEPRFAQIGNARFYAYTGGPLTFERYMAALKAGHTFVSTGPMILLTVNGKMPGDTVDVQRGSRVRVSAEAFAAGGLRSIELIAHSKVLARTEGKDAAHLTVEFELPADHGIWIAARCEGSVGQVAHTSPVYVTVGGGGFENRETLSRNLDVAEGYLREVEGELANPGTQLDRQASRHKAQLERQIAEARGVLAKMGKIGPVIGDFEASRRVRWGVWLLALAYAAWLLGWSVRREHFFFADDWDWLYRADLLTLKEQFWLVPRYPFNDRPIGALVIRVMYRIFGLNPVPSHVLCLGLHLVNMTLLLAVARRILSSWWVSAAAALAFGIWSAAIGGVTWIADIFDVLGATLVLLSTLTFLSKSPGVRATSVIFYILAARTKEATLGLPAVLLLWVLTQSWWGGQSWLQPAFSRLSERSSDDEGGAERPSLPSLVPHLAVALFLMIVYIPIMIVHQKNPDVTYRMEISPKTFVEGLFYYFSRLMYGGPWPIGRLIRWTIAIGALAAGMAWRPRVALLGLAGFVVYLGPVIFMARQRDAIYLYIPTAFLSLAFGAAAEAVAARWRLRGLSVAGAMAAFCLLALPHRAHMRSKAEWILRNTAQAERDLTSFRAQVPTLKSGAHVRLENFPDGYNVFRTPGCSVLKVAYHVEPVHCEFSNDATPADVVVVRRGDGIEVRLP